jgi:hypothetical protein
MKDAPLGNLTKTKMAGLVEISNLSILYLENTLAMSSFGQIYTQISVSMYHIVWYLWCNVLPVRHFRLNLFPVWYNRVISVSYFWSHVLNRLQGSPTDQLGLKPFPKKKRTDFWTGWVENMFKSQFLHALKEASHEMTLYDVIYDVYMTS